MILEDARLLVVMLDVVKLLDNSDPDATTLDVDIFEVFKVVVV